ncbi:transposase [Halosquirtibacter xylanolyticus]|uniref:transposase n=1 Tax=Halosquirtibacter xylanolyticus TaxID=3374599 RepID=UPI0037481387|nr:transposase [Prolixibacteraceae bacterium]
MVYLSGLKLYDPKTNQIEYLIIASFNRQERLFSDYKQRWQIETIFKALKPSGLNMENTHLKDLKRISKLLSMIMIAYIWSCLAGNDINEKHKNIQIKSHGRKAFSLFKYGLLRLASALFNNSSFEYDKIKKAKYFSLRLYFALIF